MIENEISIGNTFKMKVHFNLVNKGSDESQIWLVTTINGKRARIYTGLRVAPQYWIQPSRMDIGERAIEDGDIAATQKKKNKDINKNLKKILEYCHQYGVSVSQDSLLDNGMEHSKERFETYIKAKLSGVEALMRKNPLNYIEDYIERKKSMTNRSTRRMLSNGTVYNHKNALKRLQLFCSEKRMGLVWEIFDRSFESKFTAWMISKNYSSNTISSQFSIMKVWLTEAELNGLISDPSFHKYSTKTYDVDNIYLTEDEIKRIYDIDFNSEDIKAQIDPKSNIEQTRDLFVVACWTGLRYGDFHDLSNATITDDRMFVTTRKTNKQVTIPLNTYVKAIVKKYNGKLPQSVDKAHTINQLQLCGKLAGIDDDVQISRIKGGKTMIQQGKKYEFIKNHTARRSFATNMYLKNAPTISIMAITGHTTEANFMKYIKVDQEQHAKIVEGYFDK